MTEPGAWSTPKDVMRSLKIKKKNIGKNRFARHSFSAFPNVDKDLSKDGVMETDSPAPKKQRLLSTASEFSMQNIPENNNPYADHGNIFNFDLKATDKSEEVSKSEPDLHTSAVLPCDWTIKTKTRLISTKPFSWYGRVKSQEDVMSTVRAVRCNLKVKVPQKIELGRCLLYWQFPEIPWLQLFPRYGEEYDTVNVNTLPVPQAGNYKNMLYDKWVCSFRSAFQHLKENYCSYFYIFSQQYTALFRSKDASNCNEINCIITPTTLGFRQSLSKENIKFTMPYKILTTDSEIDEVNMETCEENQNPVDDAMWNDVSKGIHIQASKVVKQAIRTDTTMHTAIFIQGNLNTNLLFNYLINCKSSIATSGTQAGIPPTILSPVAFLNATLKKLTVKSGTAKIMSGNKPLHCFSIDITGPILPTAMYDIVELIKSTQPENFQFNSTVAKYSIPFNVTSKCIVDINSKIKNCSSEKLGIQESTFRHLFQPPVCIREAHFKNNAFSWQS